MATRSGSGSGKGWDVAAGSGRGGGVFERWNLLLPVVSMLPRPELNRVTLVNKAFAAACSHDSFWHIDMTCIWGDAPELWCGRAAMLKRLFSFAALRAHAHRLRSLVLIWKGRHPLADGAQEQAQAAAEALALGLRSRLRSLHIVGWPGSDDPIFGTEYERRRQAQLGRANLFASLAAAFSGSAEQCCLKELTLQEGPFSAASFIAFLACARPALQVFRCVRCLFHGRNFASLVEGLRDSNPCPEGLAVFETDAYVAGEDPYGLLSEAFPGLRSVRTPHIYGDVSEEQMDDLEHIDGDRCEMACPRRRLKGNFVVLRSGDVSLFLTSPHHDDQYRGEGLWWGQISNTSECSMLWTVGAVTDDMVMRFLQECGIQRDTTIPPPDEESDDVCSDDDDEEEAERE